MGSSQMQLLSVVKILLDGNSTFYNYYHGLTHITPDTDSSAQKISYKVNELVTLIYLPHLPVALSTRGEAGASKTPEAVRRNC